MALGEKKDLAQYVNDFLFAKRKVILSVLGCVFGFVIVGLALFVYFEKSNERLIADVEKIIYDFEEFKTKNKKDELSDENIENLDGEKKNEEAESASENDKQEENADVVLDAVTIEENAVIEKLSKFVFKNSSSYVLFRASTAIAEIYFQRKNFEEALKYYEKAGLSGKNNYTAGVAYFNAAAAADELGDTDKALEYYKKAYSIKDFPLKPRAMFNSGRICEALDKKEDAILIYNELLQKFPRDEWALLAKSRIIVISE